MEIRTFHGSITPADLALPLSAEFDQGNLRSQVLGDGKKMVVQIATPGLPASGGHTTVSVELTQVEDGVLARVGQQEWLGVAASIGKTALMALRNPLSLISRLDDLAQDVGSIQLIDRIWDTIGRAAQSHGASHEISERLRRVVCPYCLTANHVGAPSCIACGAPMGPSQPVACGRCGFVTSPDTRICPSCGFTLID
ncbi:MAG TPA: zinc ribbon domain-containing protein [Anaerolineales bacterium]|nr:zinc ribbon domain-containing protein [Anaerolineales bacterium]